jgi:UrcA family protein
MLKPISALAVALIASTFAPTIAQADVPSSVRVGYADLNLGNSAGQHVLQNRISSAATQVCAAAGTKLDLQLVGLENSCFADTIASAQPAYEAAINAARHGTVTVLDGAALIITAQ